jgi:hypothetical protein
MAISFVEDKKRIEDKKRPLSYRAARKVPIARKVPGARLGRFLARGAEGSWRAARKVLQNYYSPMSYRTLTVVALENC